MDHEVKFRWRQRPPKVSEQAHKRAAGMLRKHLKKMLPCRPWSKRLQVAVSEDKPSPRRGGRGLAMWVTAPSSVDAFWAASLMAVIHCSVSVLNPQVKRIAVTAPREPATGYAPLISWRFGSSDGRPKSIRESEINGLVRHLNWSASVSGRSGGQAGGTDLLFHVARDPGVQWEAVSAFVHHASIQEFLNCTPTEALSALTAADRAKHPAWTREHGLTRWQAVKTLAENGLLDGFIGRQRPLRPVGSTASLEEIRKFVTTAFCLQPEDLAGADRHAHIMHARYMAAAVMRRTTSRSLKEIGECLGGRDHATIINGLNRIEKWRRLDPMHSWLVESFAQIADNLGLLKVPALRRMAMRQLEQKYLCLDKQCPINETMKPVPPTSDGEGRAARGKMGEVITVPFSAMSRPVR